MPEKGLKKQWRHHVIKGIISANSKGLLEMPFLSKKEAFLNLRGVISVISKFCWYVYIGTRLAEVGLSIKTIGRYTKKPVIAEARMINVTERWIIFKFKDCANSGKTSIKKMGTFTFITYLTQPIPNKYFRVVTWLWFVFQSFKRRTLTKSKSVTKQTGTKRNTKPQNMERKKQREHWGRSINMPELFDRNESCFCLLFI